MMFYFGSTHDSEYAHADRDKSEKTNKTNYRSNSIKLFMQNFLWNVYDTREFAKTVYVTAKTKHLFVPWLNMWINIAFTVFCLTQKRKSDDMP